jgi:hypothetical protein
MTDGMTGKTTVIDAHVAGVSHENLARNSGRVIDRGRKISAKDSPE